jgi:O-antigen/teichoic acid export membrane protein
LIKDFLKEGTLYAIAGVAAKGISLMLIPVFTAYFATVEFGIIEIIYVFSTLVSGFLSWQLGQALIRFLGEHQHDPVRKKYISTTALVMVVASYALGTTLLVLFRSDLIKWIGLSSKSHEKTFAFAMIAMFFNGLYLFLGSHLQSLRFKREFALSQFIHSFFGIAITYFMVISLDKGVNGIYYAAIVVFPIVIAYQLFALRKEFGFGFSKPIAIAMLRFSIPMVPAGIALLAFTLSDRILINIYSTQAQLGIYSVAFKFAFGLQLIIAGYSMAIHPIVFQNYRNDKTKDHLSSLLLGYTVVGALAVFLLSLFAMETVVVFTQPAYFSAYKVMPLLYAITWINGFVMFAPGMQVSKKTIWISVIICAALLVNIVLAYFFIPTMGIRGAALGTLIGTILYVIGLFVVSMKLYPYQFEKKSMISLVSITIAFVIVITVFFQGIVIRMNLAAKFSVTFILLAMVLFFFIFQNLNKQEAEGEVSH